jgi:hypothetical protein
MHTNTAHASPAPCGSPAYREDTLGYVAHCGGCGTYYTPDTWMLLPIVGTVDHRDGTYCEMRDCQCLAHAGRRGAYTLGAELEVLP